MTSNDLMQKASRALTSAQLLYTHDDYKGAYNRSYYAMYDFLQSITALIEAE